MLELFALREASLIIVQPLMSVGLIGLVFAAAVVASGVASVTAESAALQRLPASRVGPIVSSVGAVLPVVLMALLSPQRVSLSPGAATLLGVGLALTGGGAYRLAATAHGGPLAEDDQSATSSE